MNTRTLQLAVITIGVAACEPLGIPRDVMGNFDVEYQNNLRVYINDELVAEVREGEDADIDYDGQIFKVSQLCGAEGTECPSDTYWDEVAIDQPWGSDYNLLNFVNLDDERGELGQRMGGTLQEDGEFDMLSGLALGANDNCVAIGVGTVTGRFAEQAQTVEDGVITYAWAGGCSIAGIEIGAGLRLETDYRAVRTGDFDLSSLPVEPEEPIDEEGGEVDPGEPEPGYERPEEG